MQTFIKPKQKQEEEKIEIKIDAEVLDTLRAYAQFLDSPQGYVVSEILRKAFRKDRAFAEWRKSAGSTTSAATDAPPAEPTSGRKSRRS